MRLLALLAGCHAALAPATVVAPADCGEAIAGIEAVADKPVILLGEMHGIGGPPEFALDLACRLALKRGEAVLALEIASDEQPRIDAYLASAGLKADRAQFLQGEFWTRPMQDGRASVARLEMFEHARRLIHAGLRLRLLAVDLGRHPGKRDLVMAETIVALAAEKRGPVLMLVGDAHVTSAPGERNESGVPWVGVTVREKIPETVSLYNRYGGGDAWACYLEGDKVDCGRHPLDARDPGRRWTLTLFPAPDEQGLHGTFDVGVARASNPAVSAAPRRDSPAPPSTAP